MKTYTLGIDWGGTRVKIVAMAEGKQELAYEVHPSPHTGQIANSTELLMAYAAAIIERLGEKPLAIGLSLTGPVDPDLGVVLLPGKINDLEMFPIVPQFRKYFQLPVYAFNDGISAMAAEKAFGLAQGLDWAVTITIGTGIGSGVLLDGRILKDPRFMFGSQLGHLILDKSNDQLCLTGGQGTGEMTCSCTALALAVRSGLQRGIPSILSETYFQNAHAIDFKAIIGAVEAGDAFAIHELARWRTSLGWLLVNAVHAYSPEKIILGGGAILAQQHFLPQVEAFVNKTMFRYPRGKKLPVLASQLSDKISALGAAVRVLDFV